LAVDWDIPDTLLTAYIERRPLQQNTKLQQPFRHSAAIAAGGGYTKY